MVHATSVKQQENLIKQLNPNPKDYQESEHVI